MGLRFSVGDNVVLRGPLRYRLGQKGTVLEVRRGEEMKASNSLDKYLVKFSGEAPEWFLAVQLAPADPSADKKDKHIDAG